MIFLNDMKKEMMNMDLDGVALLIKNNENKKLYHGDIKQLLSNYSNEKFKVKNQELKKLRDDYYIELAKEKLLVSLIIISWI